MILLHEIVLMHTYDALSEIHRRTSFHPWHRIFNMHLERELQEKFPQVTIPYWKFDEKAERVFTSKFIGVTEKSVGAPPQPKFDKTNPLVNYFENTIWGTLNRAYNNRNPASQNTFGQPNDVLTENKIVDEGPKTFELWSVHEERFSHNYAHGVFSGDVADVGKDPIDPLFFMMHSNVDRLWAKWQHKYDRFDGNQKETYPYQGKYQGKRGTEWIVAWKQSATQQDLDFFNGTGFYSQTNKDIGNFVEDTLWPWNLDTDDSRPMRAYKEGLDPEFGEGRVPEIEIEFPKSPASNYPGGPITVKSTIDYQDRLNNTTPLGFDYDDIPYFDYNRKPQTEIVMDHLKDNAPFQKHGEKHNSALLQLNNKENDLNLRLDAIGSIDETSEAFLDTILDILADSSEPADLRADLINKMLAAKRANSFFPSKKPRFFGILRGLIKDNNQKLRFKAIDFLASNQDEEVQNFLVGEIEKDNSTLISKKDAIFFLRQNPKPEHAKLFKDLFDKDNDPEVKKAAIKALGNDPGSVELLEEVVEDKDKKHNFKIREAAASSLHNLDPELMNDLAAQILVTPESGPGIKLFRSTKPNGDEVDFKAGLLNMLAFTGDFDKLRGNDKLKENLEEVGSQHSDNKSLFKSTFELNRPTHAEEQTIIEQLAQKLLARIQ